MSSLMKFLRGQMGRHESEPSYVSAALDRVGYSIAKASADEGYVTGMLAAGEGGYSLATVGGGGGGGCSSATEGIGGGSGGSGSGGSGYMEVTLAADVHKIDFSDALRELTERLRHDAIFGRIDGGETGSTASATIDANEPNKTFELRPKRRIKL